MLKQHSFKRLSLGLSVAVAVTTTAMGAMMSSSLFAAETTDLMQIYQMALNNDAQLAAAQATFSAAEEAIPQSRSALLPNIGMTGQTSSNRNQLLESNSLPSGNRTSNWNSHGWSATLSQPLFNLESWFSFERAGLLTEQARLAFALEQQNLIMRVSEAYFNVLRADDNLLTAKAEETAVKRQLEQTRQRLEVGLIAQTDVHEARAVYDATRVIRIQAGNEARVAQENMRTLTNNFITDLAKLDSAMPIATPAPMAVEQWVNTSIAQNLNLQAARRGVDAAGSQLRVSKSGHAPTLSAVATYGHNVDPTTGTTFDDYRTNGKTNSTSYSLQLSIPIFSGGYTSSKVRESSYRLDESMKKTDLTLREVSANIRNLFNTVNADVDQVDARCQGIVSASSALKATESGYEVGTRNIVDVLDAQKSLYSAQRDYLNARYDFIVNTLKLKQTAGTLSPGDLQDLNLWMKGERTTELTPACKAS